MRLKAFPSMAATLLLVLVVAACTGSDPSPTTPPNSRPDAYPDIALNPHPIHGDAHSCSHTDTNTQGSDHP